VCTLLSAWRSYISQLFVSNHLHQNHNTDTDVCAVLACKIENTHLQSKVTVSFGVFSLQPQNNEFSPFTCTLGVQVHGTCCRITFYGSSSTTTCSCDRTNHGSFLLLYHVQRSYWQVAGPSSNLSRWDGGGPSSINLGARVIIPLYSISLPISDPSRVRAKKKTLV